MYTVYLISQIVGHTRENQEAHTVHPMGIHELMAQTGSQAETMTMTITDTQKHTHTMKTEDTVTTGRMVSEDLLIAPF